MKSFFIVGYFFLLVTINASAQDTVLIYNNYKYKLGFKVIEESSYDDVMPQTVTYVFVKSFGLQLCRNTNIRGFSFESGFYWMNKGHNFLYLADYGETRAKFYYHNLSIPVCIRFDTRTIYFSIGAYADLLMYRSRGDFNDIYADSAATALHDRKFKLGVMGTIGVEKEIDKTLTFFFEGRLLLDVTSSRTQYYDTRKEAILDKPFFGNGYINVGGAIGINYKFLRNK